MKMFLTGDFLKSYRKKTQLSVSHRFGKRYFDDSAVLVSSL